MIYSPAAGADFFAAADLPGGIILLKKYLRSFVLGAVVVIGGSGTAFAETVQLTLADSVQMALDQDGTIQKAEAAEEAARWSLSAARRSAGPSLQWSSNALGIGGRDYRKAPNMDSTYGNTLGVQMPLYTGGRIEGNIKRYEYELNAADLQIEGTRQAVRYKAVAAYYDVLQKKNLLSVSESAVHMAEEELRIIQVQFGEGTVARSDVIRMETQMAEYQQNKMEAKGNLEVALSTLRSCLGLDRNVDIELVDSLGYEMYDKNLQDCLSYAFANRPDGLAAAYKIKAAEAAKDAEKAGNRPTISGVANRNIVGNDPFKQERNSNWQYGVQMTWNFFDNNVTAAKVNAAKAAIEQQKADAYETEKLITLQTETVYTKMRAAEDRIKVAEKAINLAEKSHELAKVRYEEGVDILVNVTDAQEKLTQARTKYVTALYEYNINKAGLEQAIGVPVYFNAERYVENVAAGKSSRKAVEAARID